MYTYIRCSCACRAFGVHRIDRLFSDWNKLCCRASVQHHRHASNWSTIIYIIIACICCSALTSNISKMCLHASLSFHDAQPIYIYIYGKCVKFITNYDMSLYSGPWLMEYLTINGIHLIKQTKSKIPLIIWYIRRPCLCCCSCHLLICDLFWVFAFLCSFLGRTLLVWISAARKNDLSCYERTSTRIHKHLSARSSE